MPIQIKLIDEDHGVEITQTFYDCGEEGTPDQFQSEANHRTEAGLNPAEWATAVVTGSVRYQLLNTPYAKAVQWEQFPNSGW